LRVRGDRGNLHGHPPLHQLLAAAGNFPTAFSKINRLLPGAAAAAGLRDTAALRKFSFLGGSVEMRPGKA
ncbi:MAG: hypothetical protein EBS05_19015, partial [Proteobacteria bacterium]|nr:hypothetical protein [Pseudomonadota bacterium]